KVAVYSIACDRSAITCPRAVNRTWAEAKISGEDKNNWAYYYECTFDLKNATLSCNKIDSKRVCTTYFDNDNCVKSTDLPGWNKK
ncbi:MAG TPA: hypothetical protein VEL47_06590, partial [Myxococcota bacterium]|nr:hypothetical protein [Myxococcota bacterium]